MRFAVVVQLDDSLRVFGTYSDAARAEAFAAKVNAAMEAREDADFAQWQRTVSETGENTPDGYGRAGVLLVRPPRVREARRFAAGEADAA